MNTFKDGLTPLQLEVCWNKGTERPFTGEYTDCEDEGVYHCVCCGSELFRSDAKYHSGSGWPSFWQPVDPTHLKMTADTSHGMRRIEIQCAHCTAHLGHVFEDGPPPTGLRFCVNSASLRLVRKPLAEGKA